MSDQNDPVSAAEPEPSTDTVQTIQRRIWIRGIVITILSMVVLVTLGWLVGAVTA